MSVKMKLSEVLSPANVILDLDARSKTRLMHRLSEIAAKNLGVSESVVFSALNKREKLGSTGIGEGIAIPHAPVPDLTKPFALFARLSNSIDFEAIDENPVDIVAVLLVPVEKSSANLNLLASLARILRMPNRIERIRAATDAKEVYRTIAESEV